MIAEEVEGIRREYLRREFKLFKPVRKPTTQIQNIAGIYLDPEDYENHIELTLSKKEVGLYKAAFRKGRHRGQEKWGDWLLRDGEVFINLPDEGKGYSKLTMSD